MKKLIALIILCYITLISTSFFRPLVIKKIMDEGMLTKEFKIILSLSVLLLVLAFLEEGINILQAKLFADLQNKVILNLYIKVYQRLLYAKMNYFAHNNSAEIINRLSTDISSVGTLVDSGIMSVVSYVLQIISGVIGLIVINWKLGIFVFLIVPIKYILISILSRNKEKAVSQWIEESADFSAWFADTVNGVKEVKLWNLYRKKKLELKMKQKRVLELGKRSTLLETYNMSGDAVLQWLATTVIYGIGGFFICKDTLSIGGLTAFLSYSNYVIGPIALVFNLKIIFAQVKPSAQRLKKFFEMETEKAQKPGRNIMAFQKAINFEKINFSYSEQPVLKDVSFKIHKGEKVAIIGDNGSGKSTLVSLLLRFLIPRSGCIYVDSHKIEDYELEQYRDLFAVVSQDIYLFKDTVKNNITMGKKISKEALKEVSRKLEMEEFIDSLPQGYDTMLEKNGENLSGGERQKIALIRAVIKDAPIIILDEATANIDKKYNDFLHNSILKDYSDKTLIIITHKLENLAGLDRVYQLNNHAIANYYQK